MSKLNVSRKEPSTGFRRGTRTAPFITRAMLTAIGLEKRGILRVGAAATPW